MKTPSELERAPGDPDLAWRVLGLLNLYRLAVPSVLTVLGAIASRPSAIGAGFPDLYFLTNAGWFFSGVLCIALLKRRWPALRTQAVLHIGFDVLAVSLLLIASLGVESGLGLLLILPIGAVSLLVTSRAAATIAAMAALAVLGQQLALVLANLAAPSEVTQAGLLGAVIFTVALAAAPLARRLRESEALVRQRDIDLANLAELSQYVVERLRESLVVVDDQDRIRLINESAREILGPGAAANALLGEVSPRLLYMLATWRSGPAEGDGGGVLLAADGLREIRPHFAPLGQSRPAPVLVFLEDMTALDDRVQQSRLAALGRLSASIAHEIRNPVGAISHAAQLLAENPDLPEADRRLTEIVQGNAQRVSTIVGNVQQLSRRASTRPERMPLGEWLAEFVDEFQVTGEHPAGSLSVRLAEAELEVRVDPTHLHQILWNLCENAMRHGEGRVELLAGRLGGSGRPFLEVADRGPGIDPALVDRIFEPFFTSRASGTGLGLFIARELAQCNRALLVYEQRSGGGSIFRIVFADPQRWEQS